MFTPHDADLCLRDRDLPGLRTLLSPPEMLATLRAAMPRVQIRSVLPTYVRYKPGQVFLAAFDAAIGERRVRMHAMACNDQTLDKYAKLTGPDEVSGEEIPGHVVLPDSRLVLNVYPNDRKLKAIRRLSEPDRLARLLVKFNVPVEASHTTVDVLAYKPERRLVGRLATDGRDWGIIRVYTEEDFGAALVRAKAIESQGPLRVARLLGKSRWQQTLGMEHLAGTPLIRLLADRAGGLAAALGRTGHALAALHAQAAQSLPRFDLAHVTTRLGELAGWIGHVHPALSDEAHRLADRIARRLPDDTADHVVSHGDFHAGQVLLPDDLLDGAAVIDLDEACLQPAAMDVANFAAHLEAGSLRGALRLAAIEPLANRLTEAYRRLSGRTLASSLGVFRAMALLRLAPEPFRRRDENWPQLLTRLLERSRQWLETPETSIYG